MIQKVRQDQLRVRAGALMLCSMLGSVSTRARAEEHPAATSTLEELLQRGVELRRAGQDSDALLQFERAATLDPRSLRVRMQLGAVHQALGHWVEAEECLSQVLEHPDDPYVSRYLPALERARQVVREHLGTLEVLGNPASAELLLDGRSIGVLPTTAPVRLPVGSYLLEVRLAGYYSVQRHITISSQGAWRESVELNAQVAPPPVAPLDRVAADPEPSAWRSNWIGWTLAGIGAGAAGAALVSWRVREAHAERWNSGACLAPGARRADVCPEELRAGRNAERATYGFGIAAGLLLGGALTSWLLRGTPEDEPQSSAARCAVVGLGVGCGAVF